MRGGSRPTIWLMMFTGSTGKRKIRLALFANLSPCGGVSDSYLVCFSPDPFRAAGGISLRARAEGQGAGQQQGCADPEAAQGGDGRAVGDGIGRVSGGGLGSQRQSGKGGLRL